MKQGQIDVVLVGNDDQFFLRPVLRPGSCHLAGILGRVRVPDHDLLPTIDMFGIPRRAEQAL